MGHPLFAPASQQQQMQQMQQQQQQPMQQQQQVGALQYCTSTELTTLQS